MYRLTDIGSGLVARRKQLGLTQRALGERLGVTQPQIARWERTAYRTASLEHVASVAEALEAPAPARASMLAAEAPAAYATTMPSALPMSDADVLARIGLSREDLARFAEEHDVVELGVFGSVLRADFGADSDVDFLVRYRPGTHRDLAALERERADLSCLASRKVDVVTRPAAERMRNPIKRRRILGSVRNLYVA